MQFTLPNLIIYQHQTLNELTWLFAEQYGYPGIQLQVGFHWLACYPSTAQIVYVCP